MWNKEGKGGLCTAQPAVPDVYRLNGEGTAGGTFGRCNGL